MPPPKSSQHTSASCPSFIQLEAAHTNKVTHDLFSPETPPEYYYYVPSKEGSSSTNTQCSTVVAGESLSSETTKVDCQGIECSSWLRKRQRQSKQGRIVLGIIGLIVFLLLITGMVAWLGNAFIFPQVPYTAEYPQYTSLPHYPSGTATSHYSKST